MEFQSEFLKNSNAVAKIPNENVILLQAIDGIWIFKIKINVRIVQAKGVKIDHSQTHFKSQRCLSCLTKNWKIISESSSQYHEICGTYISCQNVRLKCFKCDLLSIMYGYICLLPLISRKNQVLEHSPRIIFQSKKGGTMIFLLSLIMWNTTELLLL